MKSYAYDALGRLVQAQSPSIGVKTYAYDKTGNVLNKEGSNYAYSNAPAHGVDSINNNSFFDYYANGNLTRTDESGVGFQGHVRMALT